MNSDFIEFLMNKLFVNFVSEISLVLKCSGLLVVRRVVGFKLMLTNLCILVVKCFLLLSISKFVRVAIVCGVSLYESLDSFVNR